MVPSMLFFRIVHLNKNCCRQKEGIEGNSIILLSGYDINPPQLSSVFNFGLEIPWIPIIEPVAERPLLGRLLLENQQLQKMYWPRT